MNTKKIATIEKAIGMLENGFPYTWSCDETCNCGVVYLATGGTRKEIFNTDGGCWSTKINTFGQCAITGLPFSIVRDRMLEHGFVRKEIIELENLSNKEIRVRANLRIDNHTKLDYGSIAFDDRGKKETLLKYLRAWVSILNEQDAKEPELKERIVYVSVPVTISEQAKELITSN